jgi:effector-binding domain-containing protein
VPGVGYDIQVCQVSARPLAAASGSLTSHAYLSQLIRELLDQVWPTLRGQGASTGHNVVMYFEGMPLRVSAGVEVPDGFEPTATVQPLSTPAGEAVTTAHWGDYTGLRGAYTALDTWVARSGRRKAGISWEIYGDWDPDPNRMRTDVFILLESAG